jgi:hypothetical protein
MDPQALTNPSAPYPLYPYRSIEVGMPLLLLIFPISNLPPAIR